MKTNIRYARTHLRGFRFAFLTAFSAPLFCLTATAEGGAGLRPPMAGAVMWINPIWLIAIVLSISFWFYVTSWAADDSLGIGLNHRFWTSLFLALGWIGALLALFLHPVFFLLLVLGVGGTGVYYLRLRNTHVPLQYQIFKSVLGTPDVRQHQKTAGDVKKASGTGLINDSGKNIQSYLERQPDQSEGVGLLVEILERACYGKASRLRIKPQKGAYVAEILKDGVRNRIDTIDPQLGAKMVAAIVSFCGLADRSKARGELKLSFQEGADTPLKVKGIKSGKRTGLVFSIPLPGSRMYKKELGELGMEEDIIKKLKEFAGTPGSSIILSGPKNSGRTATFYGAISLIDIFMNDVVTFEKHIRATLDQVKQVEVDLGSAGDFEQLLPAILREEPHVLAANGLSNNKVAARLFEYAADGGSMIATLEGPDAAQALTLLAGKVPPELLKKSLKLMTGQRLLRRLCLECREEVTPSPKTLSKLQIDPENPGHWFRAVGCGECLGIGYDGLIGIFEMLVVNDSVGNLLLSGNVTPDAIKKAAGPEAYRTLYRDAVSKVQKGYTTMEEAKRVLNR